MSNTPEVKLDKVIKKDGEPVWIFVKGGIYFGMDRTQLKEMGRLLDQIEVNIDNIQYGELI